MRCRINLAGCHRDISECCRNTIKDHQPDSNFDYRYFCLFNLCKVKCHLDFEFFLRADIVQIFIIQLNISSNLSIIHKFEKYLRWGNELSFSSLNFFINIRLSNIVWNFGNFSEIVILQKFFFLSVYSYQHIPRIFLA